MLQVAAPHEIYEEPATAEVAAFIGRSNFLDGKVVATADDTAEVQLIERGETVRIASAGKLTEGQEGGLPAGKVYLAAEGDEVPQDAIVLKVEIVAVSYVGSRYEYDVAYGTKTIMVDSNRRGLTGAVSLVIPADAARIYPHADVLSSDAEEFMAAAVTL